MSVLISNDSQTVFLVQREIKGTSLSPNDEVTIPKLNTSTQRREIILRKVGLLNHQLSAR